MKQFILKSLLLGLFLITLNLLVSHKLPYHWARTKFSNKLHLLDSLDKKDILFWGSSRIQAQINPYVFDRVTEKKSFNIGVPGLFNPESYYLYEHWLNTTTYYPKYILMELQPGYNLANINRKTKTGYYWSNINNLKFTAQQNGIINGSFWEIIIRNYLLLSKEKLRFSEKNIDKTSMGERLDGFYSLDKELTNSTKKQLKIQFDELKNDTSLLEKRRKMWSLSDVDCQGSPINIPHLNKINSLIKLSDGKGIKLILLLTPRQESDEPLYCLYQQIPTSNKLNLADSDKYPEFYSLENSFDKGHLNEKGATLFTQKLAEEFLKINNK